MTLSDSGAADAAAPADDLRADLEAAFNAPEATESAAPEPDTEQPARERDASGRFASKATDEPEKAPEADETAEAPAAPADASKPSERLAAPAGWPADAVTAWDRLPKAAQEAIKADLDAGRLSVGTQNTAPDPVREVIKAYEPQFARRGLAPERALRDLFEAQQALDANPVEGFKWLLRSYGVDPRQLVPDAGATQDQQGYVDPTVQALVQKVTTLESTLTQRQRAEEAARYAEHQRSIDAFAQEKAADGTALRPYFSEVRNLMGQMLASGAAESLADAYDKAVWARPDIRTRILDQERKAEAAKRAAEQAKAAEEAKKRAVSVRSNPSVSAAPVAADNLRAELERAWQG